MIRREHSLAIAMLLGVCVTSCKPSPSRRGEPERLISTQLGQQRQDGLPPGAIARLGGGAVRAERAIDAIALTPAPHREVFLGSQHSVEVFSMDDGVPGRAIRESAEMRRFDAPIDMAFSPSSDRLVIATRSRRAAIEIWNTRTRRLITALPRATRRAPLFSIASSADEMVVVTEDSLQVIDLVEGGVLRELPLREGPPPWWRGVLDLTLSPDDETIYMVGRGGLDVMSASTGKRAAGFNRRSGYIQVAIDPRGELLALARPASHVELRRPGALDELLIDISLGNSLGRVEQLALSPGGELLFAQVTGAGDIDTLRVYRLYLEEGRAEEVGRFSSDTFELRADGLLAVAKGRVLRRYMVDTTLPGGLRALDANVGHARSPATLSIARGGDAILSTSRDGRVIRWPTSSMTGELLRQSARPGVSAVGQSPDGAYVISTMQSSGWELAGVAPGKPNPLWREPSPVPFARLHVSGDEILAVEQSGVFWRFDARTRAPLARWPLGGKVSRLVAQSDDLSRLIIYERDSYELRVWRTSDGALLDTIPWRVGPGYCAWHDKAEKLACLDLNWAYFFELGAEEPLARRGHGFARLDGVTFSPDATYVVSWGVRPGRREMRYEIRILPVDESEPAAIFTDVPSRIESAVFMPDERYLVTGHEDGLLYVWDVSRAVIDGKPRE